MELEIRAQGVDRAVRRLTRLGFRATHTRPFFEQVVDEFVESNKANWRGSRWEPLKPDTVARKQRHGDDPRPMRATGALEASLTKKGDSHQIKQIKADELRWGSDLFYSRFSQNKKKVTKTGQPRRRILAVRPKQRKNIRSLLKEHVLT